MSLKDMLRIAVVDDTAVSRGLLVEALESIGITRIQIYKDGQQALDGISHDPPHLVISDYFMPKLDGLELLKSLRALEATREIGFILVTARADPDVIQRGRSLRMNNLVEKPISADKIRQSIEQVAGRLS
jgi:two-component system chemotaxis response regulator CheY